jgi:hypothetical protein
MNNKQFPIPEPLIIIHGKEKWVHPDIELLYSPDPETGIDPTLGNMSFTSEEKNDWSFGTA